MYYHRIVPSLNVTITELVITELFYYGLLLPNVAHSPRVFYYLNSDWMKGINAQHRKHWNKCQIGLELLENKFHYITFYLREVYLRLESGQCMRSMQLFINTKNSVIKVRSVSRSK